MPSVRATVDLRRVRDLPRRRLSEDDAAAWAAVWTAELKKPGGTMALLPWQGYVLAELAEHGGAFAVLPVGMGKTLISYLAAVVVGAQRPLVIVPANLREKTYTDFASYGAHWRAPRTPAVIRSREELALEQNALLLEGLRPDLIVIDEADEFANAEKSAPARIDRYIVAHPETMVLILTGTPIRKSIMNFWHLLCWALRERAPMPMNQGEAREWALAIDEARGRDKTRMTPGPLGATAEAAREWFHSRLVETPGVVVVDGDSCAAPLTVRVRLAREDRKLDVAFDDFLHTQELPDGQPVTDPLSRWRIDGQLGIGLFLRWNPAPPEPWKDARRAVGALVRTAIQASQRTAAPLDTEGQVLRRYAAHPVVAEWARVRDTFTPRTEAVWLSTSCIDSVRDWLAESDEPGIVWSGCVEFSRALATATRLPYYGREGKDEDGRGLHEAAVEPLIASWHANRRGFNLQAWRRQLVVMPPQSAKWLEQMFGRSHRYGQTGHVVIDVLATSGGTLDGFDKALGEARFGRDTVGPSQKILRAAVERATPVETRSNKYRWARADH